MGIVRVNGERSFKIDGANQYQLGDAALGVVGTLAIHIVNDATLVGAITVKARSRVKDASDANIPFLPIPYEKLYLNGAVGDGSLVSTTITGDSIILVPASGLEIALDLTGVGAYTSGSATAYVSVLEGAAA